MAKNDRKLINENNWKKNNIFYDSYEQKLLII